MSLSLEKKLLDKVTRYEELLDHSAVTDCSKTNNTATRNNYAKLQEEREQESSLTHHNHKGSHYEEERLSYKEEQEKQKNNENNMCKSRLYTSSKAINEPAIMSRAEIHELSVQSKLDVLTQRLTHAAAVQSARLSRELQHVNHKIAHEVEELGLKAYLHESGATVIQNVQAPETHAQSSARFAGNQEYTNRLIDKSKSKCNAQTKSHVISHAMLHNDKQYAFRNIIPVSFNKSGFESLIQ